MPVSLLGETTLASDDLGKLVMAVEQPSSLDARGES